MVGIVDYGVGNLFSLKSSFEEVGEKVIVVNNPEELKKCDKIILPGVGAFSDAAAKLKSTGFDEVIKEYAKKGVPIMGICLGMQLLFDKSYEYGEHQGLGLIDGDFVPIESALNEELKIPHIGWNALEIKEPKSKIFKYLNSGECVYFVHSYYAKTGSENVIASTEYGAILTAAVQKENVYGCQFHPEKSGKAGLKILKAFCEI